MSHSSGSVVFHKDGLVMHCEYDGTSDIMIPALWDTEEEMIDNWRTFNRKKCSCGNFEPVTIYSNYGGGFDWEGEACRTCKAINNDHLESGWKEDLEYRNQRNTPWGFPEISVKVTERNSTQENADNFNQQAEQLNNELEKALEGFIGKPIEFIIGEQVTDIAKDILLAALQNPDFDLVITNVKMRNGAKPLRSKKKRLVKKWNKKNLIMENKTTYKHMRIVKLQEGFLNG